MSINLRTGIQIKHNLHNTPLIYTHLEVLKRSPVLPVQIMWLCMWMYICAHMGKMIGMMWRGYADRNSVRRFSNFVCFFLQLFLFIPLVLIAWSSHSSSFPHTQTPCLFPLSRENPSLSCLYSLSYFCSDVDCSLLMNDLTANSIHI